LTAAFAAQEKGKDAKAKPAAAPAAGAPAMDPELMKKFEAFATPGPDHKVLDALVGKWTVHVKWWMDAAAPPMESDGTSEAKWIMGGRYLEEEHKGQMMGMPFEGMGITGFDNLKKKYVGTWIDNSGTGIMTSEGTYDAAKKTMSGTCEMPDQTMSKYVPCRTVSTMTDANSHKMEFYMPDKSGKEFRCGELAYTRAK
jgi:hypothetical protein